MDKKPMSLNFSTAFTDISDLNSNFAAGKMKIAYHGRNRNMSDIEKDVFEDAIPSMYNCPIVARYDRNNDEFGSHDIEVVIKDHAIKIVNATVPLGVVPKDANWEWETIQEEDGSQHEYLVTDALFWKRQEAFEHLADVGNVDQSMECNFLQYHIDDDGYLVADKMEFSAFCLLESAAPCFESANVKVFSDDEIKNQFVQMISDLKECLTDELNNFSIKSEEKGGKNLGISEEVRDSILTEFKLTLEQLNFEITDEMTEEDFRAKVDELSKSFLAEPESTVEDSSTENKTQKNSFAITYGQKRDAIQNALESQVVLDGNDNVVSETDYWLSDFDDTYLYANRYTWTTDDYQSDHVRATYSFDADQIAVTLTSDFEVMILQWLTPEENQKLETSRNAFEDLKQFKEARLAEDHKKQVEDVLKEFSDIAELEEYSELLKKAYDFENIEDLKTQCFAIRGKQVKIEKQKTPETVKVPLDDAPKGSRPYGGLFDTFSRKYN